MKHMQTVKTHLRRAQACACCGRLLTAQSADSEHQYTLGIFELVIFEGRAAALRVGWRAAGLCKSCVQRIHAAGDSRAAQKRAERRRLDSLVCREAIAPCARSGRSVGAFMGKN